MDVNTALSMEVNEMAKMRRKVSPGSSTTLTTTVRKTTVRQENMRQTAMQKAEEKDLISFFEGPPAVSNNPNDWSFFEQTSTSMFSTRTEHSTRANSGAGLLATSNVRSSSFNDFFKLQSNPGVMPESTVPTMGMKRTPTDEAIAPVRQSGFGMTPSHGGMVQQTPATLLQMSTTNPFKTNFVPTNVQSQHFYGGYKVFPQHVNTMQARSQTPPAISDNQFFSSSATFGNEGLLSASSLSKSWNKASFSVGNSPLTVEKNETESETKSSTQQDDEINAIFQRWLDESSETPTEENESFLQDSDPMPSDWKEWDPLNRQTGTGTLVSLGAENTQGASPTAGSVKSPSTHRPSSTAQGSLKDAAASDTSQISEFEDTPREQFVDTVVRIHTTFPFDDNLSNPGYLISPMMPKWQAGGNFEKGSSNLKVSITTEGLSEPVVFTCNINACVEHVVSQALCIAHEDISQITTSDYHFKVAGRQELLLSGTTLSLYEYVQDCIKFDEDVHLHLLHRSSVDTSLIRSENDDRNDALKANLTKAITGSAKITREKVQIVRDAFFAEVKKLDKNLMIQSNLTLSQQCDRIIQSVKAVRQVLGAVETIDVTYAMLRLRNMVEKSESPSGMYQEVFNGDGTTTAKPTSAILTSDNAMTPQERIDQAVQRLTTSVCCFIDMYCKAMELDSPKQQQIPTAVSCNIQDSVTLNIVSAHRLPHMWTTMYEEYYFSCQLYYGSQELCAPVLTKTIKANKSFNARITWNNWLTFPLRVSDLPRESKLCLTLHGYPVGNDTTKPEKVNSKELTWVNVPLFNHRSILLQGGALYGMWSAANTTPQLRTSAMCSSNIANPDSVVVNVQVLSSQQSKGIMFPPYSLRLSLSRTMPAGTPISSLDESTQQDLAHILSKNPFSKLSDHERDLIWKHRHVREYNQSRGSLARLLRSVPSWSPRHLSVVYKLLETWPVIEPIEAFELLSYSFPDAYVRKFAMRCIQQAEEDEIHDYLVQLTQALKYEMFPDSTLARFLIRSALGSIRIAHKLYWLLAEYVSNGYCGERYHVMLCALDAISGMKMKKEFEKEAYLVKMINRVAEAVKYAKDSARMTVLEGELERVASRVRKHCFRLPTNPSLVSNGIDVGSSSYFTSNAIPLKLAFNNAEESPTHFHLMYKVGDDLRQDVLTMQLVRIMDKLWLAEGLDLKMITFACLSTGKDRGFIELVSDSITLREIQSSYGLTGAFKDRPIAEWLQKHNPTGITYEKAEENFTLSLAGYCVATYVLGICDRHNDNIMLRQSGHIFHIDFAKFLGHAQMFGNIKRDRTPFVLTPDMVYVVNGGDRPSSRFHDFVDICCRAFNVIRKNSHMFINLLSLMIHSGIPELKSTSDLKYVYDALKPAASDTEATAMFTRLIESSIRSSFTRINFFIHNLAQLRFHGNEAEDKNSLSFASKIYTANEDGTLDSATVVGFQKQYKPEKHYVFCVRLKREMRAAENYVYRTFDEFAELHHKLELVFPSWKLPSFPPRVIVGRSQIKQVADKRKSQLNTYLHALLHTHLDVSKSDLIYTFFHPLLRDEQGYFRNRAKVKPNTSLNGSNVGGEIKLSIHHKNNALYVMVMHCRNLISPDGNDPDPYVKTYLLPDPPRSTKRKTKVARKTLHPTYNEMLIYDVMLSEVKKMQLYVSVWNYEQLNENDFMGSVMLQLDMMDLHQDNTAWYPLTSNVLR